MFTKMFYFWTVVLSFAAGIYVGYSPAIPPKWIPYAIAAAITGGVYIGVFVMCLMAINKRPARE